ncbi:hypothetical protein ACIF8T_01395 [Streptomyces sp. NPDC085946]|uniref:hypothetical protein n=1 Tax=Streptomyces sp. NPDC085946 TaxID=3365744 RepID=UPI0037CFC43C
MTARDDGRHEPGPDGVSREDVGRDGVRRDGAPYDGVRRDGVRRNGVRRDGVAHEGAASGGVAHEGPVYGGVDALMAALLDEPLPPQAARDPEFTAAHRAAAADVAVLRTQLGLIGEALAHDGGTPAAASASVSTAPEAAAGGGPAPGPEASGLAPVRPLPARPRRRRPLALALRTAAAAAAATAVVGLGWLVAGSGGGTDGAGGSQADAGSAKEARSSYAGPGHLACARLVAEGTVGAVEPVPGTGRERVTLDVTRTYLPEQGSTDEVSFVRTEGVHPALRVGDEVLVVLGRDGAVPDALAAGEEDVARERARILGELPRARELGCQ